MPTPFVDNVCIFPLTPTQRWICDTRDVLAVARSYSIVLAAETTLPVERERLLAALHCLVIDHDALRASYDLQRGVLRVVPPTATPSDVAHALSVDTVAVADGDWDALLRQEIVNEELADFDLEVYPLMRVRVLERGDRRCVLLTVHHSISDGHAFQIIARRLFEYYFRGAATADRSRASDVAAVDAVQLQRTSPARLGAWLDEARRLRPAPAERQVRTAGRYSRHFFLADDALNLSAASQGATLGVPAGAIVFHAILGRLGQLMELSETGVAFVHHGRSSAREANAIGEMAQWVLIGRALREECSPAVFWRGLQRAGIEAPAYWSLVRAVDPSLGFSRFGLAGVLFNYMKVPTMPKAFESVARWRSDLVTAPQLAAADLYIVIVETGSGLHLAIRTNDLVDVGFKPEQLTCGLGADLEGRLVPSVTP